MAFLKNTTNLPFPSASPPKKKHCQKNPKKQQNPPQNQITYLLKDFKDQHSSQFIFHVVPLLSSYRFCYKTAMTIRVEVI